MERIINKRKPLTNEQKALKISLGYYNRDFDTVLVAVESNSIFTEDNESIRKWAEINKQTLIVVKKNNKLLIGENHEPVAEAEVKDEKPKKTKK